MIRSADLNFQIPKAGLGIFSTGQSSRGPALDPKSQTRLLSRLHVLPADATVSVLLNCKVFERVCEGLRDFLVVNSDDSWTGHAGTAVSVSLSSFVCELWRLGRLLCVDQI